MARQRDYRAEGAKRRLREVQQGKRAYSPADPKWHQAGFANEDEYRQARRKAKQWSDRHSHIPETRYRPSMNPLEFRAYFDGMVDWQHKTRSKVKHYLLGIGYMSAREFEERYPPPI